MEVRSVASSGDASSALTQGVDKGQNMDAFSELLAMLFSNMLIPGINQYNQMQSQGNTADSNNLSRTNTGLNNMLSMIDNLRISGSQLTDTENIQNFINGNSSSLLSSVLGNNTDFQKLFNLTDNVQDELQEFINSINGSDSKEAEVISTNTSADNTPQESSKNIAASEINAMLDFMNILKDENGSISESKSMPDTIAVSKKISDLLNMLTTEINADKSSNESVKILNNSLDTSNAANVKDINKIIETIKKDTNNSADTQGDAKSMKPEVKTIASSEPTNNSEQAAGLNNIKNEHINNLVQQPKVPESAVIEKPQDIIDVTVEKFKTLKLPGSTEVTVKLRPEELGDVSLKLVLEKGQINGSITAERKEVVSMLQNNLDQLKTDLKNNNVNLNNITVNIQAGEDFNRNNSRRGFNSKQSKSNPNMIQAFDEEIQSNDSLEGLNIIA